MANRSYGESYRNEAVERIAQKGHSITEVARDLSVSTSTVHRWVCEAVANRGLPHQRGEPATQTPRGPAPAATPDGGSTLVREVLERITALEQQIAQLSEGTA